MLKHPASHPAAAVKPATHHERRRANHSTGSGANHISGHHGSRPLPNHSSSAVVAATRIATAPDLNVFANLSANLFANSTHVPPYRFMAVGSKLFGRHADASAQIQHRQSLPERAG